MRLVHAVVVLSLSAVPLAAQDWKGSGRLEGRVVDADGKPVEGATVKLAHPERGGGPTIKTDKKGKWAYLGLVAGTWNVDVEAAGFATMKGRVSMPSEGARVPPIETKLEKTKPSGPPPEVLAAIQKAEDAYKAGRHDEAIAEYDKLLALRPDLSTTIHQQLGFAYIQTKEYAKALEHLRKVMEADPANAQIRVIAAQAALEGGMLAEGKALLAGIDETTVKNPDVFFNMGVNFLNANQPEDAIAYFTKAIALDPAYVDGYFRRGFAYVQVGKLTEAKQDLHKVIELVPEDSGCMTTCNSKCRTDGDEATCQTKCSTECGSGMRDAAKKALDQLK
jgi:tetratricopeptide (TPR) repeat protein